MIEGKTVVFTLTTGRTGTTLLTNVLAEMPDTKSVHEPFPFFHEIMRPAQQNPFLFHRFWEAKLTHILSFPESVYIETSNVFSKGFLPTLLRLGVKPKLIFLNRSPRKIALSLLSRNSIPGKSTNGLKYSTRPGDPISLPLLGQHWSNYQRCYWAAIDTLFKQKVARAFYEKKIHGVFDLRTKDIAQPKIFMQLVNFIYPETHTIHTLSEDELLEN